MKILCVVPDFDKVVFFLNLSIYLRQLGCEVSWSSSRIHVCKIAKSHHFNIAKAGDPKEIPDRVIFWNATNSAEKSHYENLGVRCWYVENGYWQGETIQVNRGGVNYEADYASLTPEQLLRFQYDSRSLGAIGAFTSVESVKFPVGSYIFGCMVAIVRGRAQGLIIKFIQIYKRRVSQRKFSRLPLVSIKETDYAFFPMQVNSDTQLIYNSPYQSMGQVISLVQSQWKVPRQIVYKTHPKEFESYSIYTLSHEHLYHRVDLESAITKAAYVININSSVGFQALESHKKVLHLGNSFYENFPGVVKCNLLEDNLEDKIRELESVKVNWDKVDELMKHFRNNIFIQGDWRRPTTGTLHMIAERIMA